MKQFIFFSRDSTPHTKANFSAQLSSLSLSPSFLFLTSSISPPPSLSLSSSLWAAICRCFCCNVNLHFVVDNRYLVVRIIFTYYGLRNGLCAFIMAGRVGLGFPSKRNCIVRLNFGHFVSVLVIATDNSLLMLVCGAVSFI